MTDKKEYWPEFAARYPLKQDPTAPMTASAQTDQPQTAIEELSPFEGSYRGLRSLGMFKTRPYHMCDFLPIGTGFTLVSGPNDVGKSSLVEWLASRIMLGTTQGVWHGVQHSVLFVLSEEDPATVKLALRALGVSPPLLDTRAFVYVCGDKSTDIGEYETVMLPEDVEWLREVCVAHDVKCVIFDALVESMGGANLNDRADVSRALRALNGWAQKENILVIGVHHNNKGYEGGAKYAVAGSAAFTDKARTVAAVDKDKDGRRVMSLAKIKGMGTNPNYEFQFISKKVPIDEGGERMVGVVNDVKPTELSVDRIRADRLSQANKSERMDSAQVIEWLEGELADGPVPYKELEKAAKINGYTQKTLTHARDRSNGRIRSRLDPEHHGKGRAAIWELASTSKPYSGSNSGK